MPFGSPRTGARNRISADVRELVRRTLVLAGRDCGGKGRFAATAYLRKQAKENPKAFLALVSKLMPTEIQAPSGGIVSLEQIVLLSLEQRRVEGEIIEGTALPAPEAEIDTTATPDDE